MKIAKIKFLDDKVLGDLELDFRDPISGRASDTVILAGENGCGKTVILERIYSFISKPQPNTDRRAEVHFELDESNALEVKEKLRLAELPVGRSVKLVIGEGTKNTWTRHRFVFESAETITKNASEYYGDDAGFRNPFRVFLSEAGVDFAAEPIKSVTATSIDSVLSSRRGGSSLAKEIGQLIVDIRAADNEELAVWMHDNEGLPPAEIRHGKRVQRFRDAIAFMFPRKELKSVEQRGGVHQVVFEEGGRDSELHHLSMGEKQIVFRGGFVLRDLAVIAGGVLLIDEPELGLHPEWQAKILAFYRTLLPNSDGIETQLVCATHSPFIVHDQPNAKVLILRRNKQSGVIEVDPEPSFPTSGAKRVVDAFNVEYLIERSASEVVLLVEGETDRTLIEVAWKKLRPGVAKFFDTQVALSHNAVRTVLNDDQVFVKNPGKKIVGLFDFDSAFDQWNGVWKKGQRLSQFLKSDCLVKRHSAKSGWALLLPVPHFREELASDELGAHSALTIELLFQDVNLLPNMIEQVRLPAKNAFKPKVKDGMKAAFSHHVANLDAVSFSGFEPIFNRLEDIRCDRI